MPPTIRIESTPEMRVELREVLLNNRGNGYTSLSFERREQALVILNDFETVIRELNKAHQKLDDLISDVRVPLSTIEGLLALLLPHDS